MEKHFTFPVLCSFGMGKKYSSTHGGIDISWWHDPNTPLLAVKSGQIIWSGVTEYGGNVVALEFDAEEGKKQWCLYQHCLDVVSYPRYVKQGEKVANMGNTGHSTGPHLHFTLCAPQDKSVQFTYQYAINHTIDPYNHILFKLKGINYQLNDKPWSGGTGSEDLKKVVEFTNDDETKVIDIYSQLQETMGNLIKVVDEYKVQYEQAQTKLNKIKELL